MSTDSTHTNRLKLSTIQARDLPEAWFLCLKEVLTNGYDYKIDRGSYQGQYRRELDYITLQILNPGTRPLVPTTPLGVPSPSTMEYVEQYLPYLMTSHIADREQYTYGQYLESQIAKAIEIYRAYGPNNNQLYMAVGDMRSIYLTDPPCLRGIDTRIRYGKLHFMVYFRSWDLWAGLPSNLAAIQLLKEYMASEIGVEDGEIIAASKGLHLYEYSWELASQIVGTSWKQERTRDSKPNP